MVTLILAFLAPFFALLAQAEPVLITTRGPIGKEAAGLILPHEHIFTDLRGPDAKGYGEAGAAEVMRAMKPLLDQAKSSGVSTVIECTTIGVGRNVPIIADLARASGLHIVVPTGVYGRANFAPKEYAARNEDDLARWMMSEIMLGIENTDVRAGFIKTAASDQELKPLEEKFLRASARASRQTGAAIASHTTSGKVAERQLAILESLGVSPTRFVWVHAQAEADASFHKRLAGAGVYIELDSVGASVEEDEKILKLMRELAAADYEKNILISQDAGWFNPGQSEGGQKRGYTSLSQQFIPKMKAAGFDGRFIGLVTRENPFRAFAIERVVR
jgi:phosphotriesterase-related protein